MSTKFEQKFTEQSGILELMDDLGKALANANPETCMLGGGNPAHIEQIQDILRSEMSKIVEDEKRFNSMVGNYTTPQGDGKFLDELTNYLNSLYKWNISGKNIVAFNGSQNAFFILFNTLAGETIEGEMKKILFPIVPEYIGYADQGLSNFFVSNKPNITYISEHEFKYEVDFDSLTVQKDVSAICLSRPTNPTGNVASDEEVERLHKIAKEKDIYLILDNAYGKPFPNIIFKEINMPWDKNIIHSFSLSKVGLPGVRTSYIVANEELVQKLSRANAILNLAPNNVGSELVRELIKEKKLHKLSQEYITPFYKDKSEKAKSYFEKYMRPEISYYLHSNEGAIFFWLWLKDCPVDTYTIYEKLKERDVIVVPGKYFFPGFENQDWKHKNECIRIAYAQEDEKVERGIKIICEEVANAYS
jgi:valine--pyruvate aminotransferase